MFTFTTLTCKASIPCVTTEVVICRTKTTIRFDSAYQRMNTARLLACKHHGGQDLPMTISWAGILKAAPSKTTRQTKLVVLIAAEAVIVIFKLNSWFWPWLRVISSVNVKPLFSYISWLKESTMVLLMDHRVLRPQALQKKFAVEFTGTVWLDGFTKIPVYMEDIIHARLSGWHHGIRICVLADLNSLDMHPCTLKLNGTYSC